MPVTPFDQLHKLLKEFEPYKNLWTTASGKCFSDRFVTYGKQNIR